MRARVREDRGMGGDGATGALDGLLRLVERFDGYADTAELMGDDASAARFRDQAARAQRVAMALLDDGPA